MVNFIGRFNWGKCMVSPNHFSGARRKFIVNVVPFPVSDLAIMVALFISRICLERLSPMPFPSGLLVKKGINILDKFSGVIPVPVS